LCRFRLGQTLAHGFEDLFDTDCGNPRSAMDYYMPIPIGMPSLRSIGAPEKADAGDPTGSRKMHGSRVMANEEACMFERRRAFTWRKQAARVDHASLPISSDFGHAGCILGAADDKQPIITMRAGKLGEKPAPILLAPMFPDILSSHIDPDKRTRIERRDGTAAGLPLLIREPQIPIGPAVEIDRSKPGNGARQAPAFPFDEAVAGSIRLFCKSSVVGAPIIRFKPQIRKKTMSR
jgi:hypothetical protein